MSDPKSLHLTFEEWLMTPSTVQDQDRLPAPWFSSEVRDAQDPRISWIDLDRVDDLSGAQISPSRHRVNEAHHQTPQRSGTHSHEKPSEEGEEVVAGHYLNRVEEVRRRDEKSGKRRRKRNRSKPERERQTPDVVQKQGTHDETQRKKDEKSPDPQSQSERQSNGSSRSRRRRKRGARSQKK